MPLFRFHRSRGVLDFISRSENLRATRVVHTAVTDASALHNLAVMDERSEAIAPFARFVRFATWALRNSPPILDFIRYLHAHELGCSAVTFP